MTKDREKVKLELLCFPLHKKTPFKSQMTFVSMVVSM